MSALQESRRELMVQLEGLMKLLKVRALALAFPRLPASLPSAQPSSFPFTTRSSATSPVLS